MTERKQNTQKKKIVQAKNHKALNRGTNKNKIMISFCIFK